MKLGGASLLEQIPHLAPPVNDKCLHRDQVPGGAIMEQTRREASRISFFVQGVAGGLPREPRMDGSKSNPCPQGRLPDVRQDAE